MSILAVVGRWVVSNLPTAVKVVKKAAELVHNAASAVDALLEGKKIISEPIKKLQQKVPPLTRIDILEQGDRPAQQASELTEIQASLDENKKRLSAINENNEIEHRRIQLQIDVMELIVSASTFERFTNNINLHAANLQIHMQTIQNTVGLLDAVNRQRVAIKAVMGTINRMINVLGIKDDVRKLEGLDIDMRPGSVSVFKAYEAFENTRALLINEIDSFSNAIHEQQMRVEAVRASARSIPATSSKVSNWLEKSVEPRLAEAKRSAEALKGELLTIPKLEAGHRRALENIKQEDLEEEITTSLDLP